MIEQKRLIAGVIVAFVFLTGCASREVADSPPATMAPGSFSAHLNGSATFFAGTTTTH
jgi:major membrane immunogen (membrane-anchored lipoprotein)